MLRNDGKYEIYIIEFRVKKPDSDSTYSNSWHEINFDSTWVSQELYAAKKEVWHEFSASGKCWQETGVHGTYDVEVAIKLYVLLKQHSIQKDKCLFRVNKKTVWQESEILWCG